jgi:hypothetical protein
VRVLAYAMNGEVGFGASDGRGGEETDWRKRQIGGRDRSGEETDRGKRQTVAHPLLVLIFDLTMDESDDADRA